MRRRFAWLWLVGITASAASIAVFAQPGSTARREAAPAQTLSVASFDTQNVIGLLGVPLGTVVRVTGVAVDGSSTRLKAHDGKTLLKIETVDGRALKGDVTFLFHRAARDVRKPTSGMRFDYYVHEYGEFDGVVTIPPGLGIERIAVANDGFHYRPHIAIHKSNPAL